MMDTWPLAPSRGVLKSSLIKYLGGDSVSGKAVHVWHFFQYLFSQNDLPDLDSLVQIKNRDNLRVRAVVTPQMNRTGLTLPGRSGTSTMSLIIMRQKSTEYCPLNTTTILANWTTKQQHLATHCYCPWRWIIKLWQILNFPSNLIKIYSMSVNLKYVWNNLFLYCNDLNTIIVLHFM